MTNYNERLDEILSKTPCSQCDGRGAYPDYDGEPEQCQFCWQLRFTFIDETKQALTSLIKELVAEAKPELYQETWYNKDIVTPEQELLESQKRQYNKGVNQYEQNLLKALKEQY